MRLSGFLEKALAINVQLNFPTFGLIEWRNQNSKTNPFLD